MINIKIEDIILQEWYFGGMIKRKDNWNNMTWISPNKDIRIEISRTNTNLKFSQSKYIIHLDCYNLMGIKIYSVSFNQIDAIRILDAIQFFIEYESGYGDSYQIDLNPGNPNATQPTLFLERSNVEAQSPDGDYMDINFTIYEYNYTLGCMKPMVSTIVHDLALSELVYEIYFLALLDEEVPTQYMDQVENITSGILFDIPEDSPFY